VYFPTNAVMFVHYLGAIFEHLSATLRLSIISGTLAFNVDSLYDKSVLFHVGIHPVPHRMSTTWGCSTSWPYRIGVALKVQEVGSKKSPSLIWDKNPVPL